LVKQRITGTGMGGVRHYSEEKYIEKSYILTKVDALLGYFEILTSPEPKKMGFHRSED
jgi:hypothetical protein